MSATRVTVDLDRRSYDVRTGSGIIGSIGRFFPDDARPGKRAFVIADAALSGQTAALVAALEKAKWDVELVRVRATEAFKDLTRLYPLYGKMIRARADRHTVLFALGGGVIGDAAGFLAATFQRGIRWVGVPTTLLAQVDSAIGGKVAVNHELGKNLIGAFHQPALVLNELDFLKTLPQRDRISGLGEIVKYGLIADPRFYRTLERDWRAIAKLEARVLGPAVTKCVKLKAELVAKDEHDRSGIREVLNFGHTFAHAIEVTAGYSRFRHGEAVLTGMRMATALSIVRGHLAPSTGVAIDALLSELPVPPIPRNITTSELIAATKRDKKKARDGRTRFVLLRDVGATVLDAEVDDVAVGRAIEAVR